MTGDNDICSKRQKGEAVDTVQGSYALKEVKKGLEMEVKMAMATQLEEEDRPRPWA